MSSPSEIVAFLRARLDEDEQTALNAQPGSWRYDRERFTVTCSGYPVASWRHEGELTSGSPLLDRTGEYMERFDPARVLEDVKSKRSIVDAYVKWSALPQAKIADHKDGFAAGLLAAVEALAATYSDHPDYEPGWRL